LSSRIKIITEKQSQLHNTDHKVADGIVAGTLAGWRSQLTIAEEVVRQLYRYPYSLE
jgi:hypothetical protein